MRNLIGGWTIISFEENQKTSGILYVGGLQLNFEEYCGIYAVHEGKRVLVTHDEEGYNVLFREVDGSAESSLLIFDFESFKKCCDIFGIPETDQTREVFDAMNLWIPQDDPDIERF